MVDRSAATVPPSLWRPIPERLNGAGIMAFISAVRARTGRAIDDYEDLWRWSVEELAAFWELVWTFYEVQSATPFDRVIDTPVMPGAKWFEGATLNYAEHVLTRAPKTGPAIVAVSEREGFRELGTNELRGMVGALARHLRELGVGRGDVVAGYLPNVPEAIVAMLATTSIGATWAVCSPDFGTSSVAERFTQVEPKVLIAADGYRFNGVDHDRVDVVADLLVGLPSVTETIVVDVLGHRNDIPVTWLRFDVLVAEPREPIYERVPFDASLWVLFSSGTTGPPKGIVHTHGGIVVDHLKTLGLHVDLRPGDRFFFHTSTSWMAWNLLIGGLLHSSTIVLYDGSPTALPAGLWTIAREHGVTALGLGAAYVTACAKSGQALGEGAPWNLRLVIASGSPLPDLGWWWLSDQLGPTVRLDGLCGGTDVCTAFLGGNEMTPVHLGELSARLLGVYAEAFDAHGRPVVDEVGEFVVVRPMPSMPRGFVGDDGRRFHETYFDMYAGVWRQGDWITLTSRGSAIVWGRSDATLNRGGVRLGSSEIYTVVENFDEVSDSLVVGVEHPDGSYDMVLFVVIDHAANVEDVSARIAADLRRRLSPRHVPDRIVPAPGVPRTLTGKKMEVPVKRLLQGRRLEEIASRGAVDRPDVLAWFADFARSDVRGASPGGQRSSR